jgi:hypothetical protein
MAALWGNVLYWVATIFASLIVAWVVWSYVTRAREGAGIRANFADIRLIQSLAVSGSYRRFRVSLERRDK